MDKGKNVQMELTEEEVRRKIERVTREIQKIKEKGLKVDMTTTIYKAAVTTLDEDLASQIRRKKEVETEAESLRKRLNLLRLEIHEGTGERVELKRRGTQGERRDQESHEGVTLFFRSRWIKL